MELQNLRDDPKKAAADSCEAVDEAAEEAEEEEEELFEDACEEAEEEVTCGLHGCGPLVGLPDLVPDGKQC